MDYIKNIYGHKKNLQYVMTLIETALKEKFNMNINNIPDVDRQIKVYMYKSYNKFKDEHAFMDEVDPYDAIETMNHDSVEMFLEYYIKEFTSKHNTNSNSTTTNGNYCSFTDNAFNQASTFLTDQQKEQEQHIQKVMSRVVDRDAYFSDRNSTMSGIYKDQGFNPRELHKNMVKSHEDNKKKAQEYMFK
jgi:hypothetical protein